MVWWVWLLVGVALLCTEIAIQTDFWLAVLGLAALTVGLLGWIGPDTAPPVQWIEFAGVAVLLTVFARRRLHERWLRSPGIDPDLVGDVVEIGESIAPDAVGGVRHRGSIWNARNVGPLALEPGATAVIEAIDGLTLEIAAEDG